MKIDIIGGGIGGLTTALFLQQKGYAIQVFEGSSAIKHVGAGIILASNAMQIYKRLGLYERLQEAGQRVSYMNLTDARLKPLAVTDLTEFEHLYQVTGIAIHRGDLQRILLDALQSQSIQLGKRLRTITEHNGYQLEFEDGSALQSDIVIGADGIHSVVRTQLLKTGFIRHAQQVCWRGVCHFRLDAPYQHQLYELWGIGKRFGFVQINDHTVYWYALRNVSQSAPLARDTNLETIMQDLHPLVGQLIRSTPKESILFNDIIDLKPMDTWQHNRSCLIGDAAHATTPNLGQGACQAIEDAYVLTQCIHREKTIQTAFRMYEKLRRAKAHKIVHQSWQLGKLAQWENTLGIWARNGLMKLIPPATNRAQLREIYDISYGNPPSF